MPVYLYCQPRPATDTTTVLTCALNGNTVLTCALNCNTEIQYRIALSLKPPCFMIGRTGHVTSMQQTCAPCCCCGSLALSIWTNVCPFPAHVHDVYWNNLREFPLNSCHPSPRREEGRSRAAAPMPLPGDWRDPRGPRENSGRLDSVRLRSE